MSAVSGWLTRDQREAFARDGFLIVPGFFQRERDLLPVQRAIHRICWLVARTRGLAIDQPPFDAADFDAGYRLLIAQDRSAGGVVYDAVKQIPAFLRLVSDPRLEAIFRELRPGATVGVAAGGSGIRIDNPGEDRFRADWHQEYPAQLRSLDGLVFWSSLVPLTEEMGPVRFCVGSHRDGLVPVHPVNPDAVDKTGAYGLTLADRDARIARYDQRSPLPCLGDLVIIDFLTLHCSGHNRSGRARWSMQVRYFNFEDPTGMQMDWQGSFAAGKDFRVVHPELVARPDHRS